MQNQLNQCASQNDLMILQTTMEKESAEHSQMFANLNEQLTMMDKLVLEFDSTNLVKSVKENSQRIDLMEIADRKNNLIIKGITHERRLERPNHLEALLRKFFKDDIGLAGVKFEEVSNLHE